MLAAVYRQARCCAYVPVVEGFGLPVVEAMAQGTPVVSTPVPSAGGASFEVEATDVASIAEGLVTAAADEPTRTDLVARGLERAASSNENGAERNSAALPTMRQQPRLVYQPHMYQRLIDLAPSRSNALELCVGTLAEMTEGNIYEAVDQYSKQGRIAYIHLRNVVGKVPHYRETFIDEGDVDMIRILAILHRNGFDGVLIPDHTPQMTCSAPWHAGMAHTLGFMLAAKAMIESSQPHGSYLAATHEGK